MCLSNWLVRRALRVVGFTALLFVSACGGVADGVVPKEMNLSGMDLSSQDFSRVDFGFQPHTVSGVTTSSNDGFLGYTMKQVNLRDSILDFASFFDVNLYGSDLSGVSAQGADFTMADLRNVNFENADLRGADFRRAALTGAKFLNADLRGSQFDSSDIGNLERGDASTKEVVFVTDDSDSSTTSVKPSYQPSPSSSSSTSSSSTSSTVAATASSSPADSCVSGTFENEDLRQRSFAGTVVCGVIFFKSDLRGVSFRGTTFKAKPGSVNPAVFACVNAVGTDFSGAVSGRDFDRVRFRSETSSCNTDFSGANFSRVKFPESDFNSANLAGALFVNADLSNSTFTAANLKGASFRGANLTGVDFINADLSGADFTGAVLKGVDLYGANTEGATGL